MDKFKQVALGLLVEERAPSSLAVSGALAVCALGLAYYQFFKRSQKYWQRLRIKNDPTGSFVVEVWRALTHNRLKAVVERTRRLGKLYGIQMMGTPRLVVADAEVLRQICIKDFDNFPNHNLIVWTNKYQRNFLAFLKGDQWRRQRAMMSPHFTSSKIKRMYRLLDGCVDDLLENFREQMISARSNGQREALVDLFATYSLYTMDGITTCCYGLKLQREKGDTDIEKAAGRNGLVRDCSDTFDFSVLRLVLLLVTPNFLLRALGFELTPGKNLEPLARRVEKMVELRRKGGANAKHDDLLQMLLDARLDDELELDELDKAENHHASLTHKSLLREQEGHRESVSAAVRAKPKRHRALETKLNELEILSEALFLLAAGLDTTRASLSTITYLLAHNPHCQERLYEELCAIAKYEETPAGCRLHFDYDELTSCQYLDAVISESLRMFSPALFTDRVAENDYYVEKYDVTIPKGTDILLGLHAVHNDPDYWHQPDRFDPDRFMPGQRENIVPGSYMPFGLGPRHCLGMRFSLTETKLGLAKVLMNYKFQPAPNTQYPPEPKRSFAIVRIKNCLVRATYRDEAGH